MPHEDIRVGHRLKLAAFWASLMLCYIYCDYFELYQPGKLQSMLSGSFGMGHTTQQTLLIASAVLAAPALMIALCTVLPFQVCRALNIVLGLAYAAIMFAVVPGTWYFYKMFAAVEIVLSLSIVWLAYRWPRELQAKLPPDA